MTDWEVTNMSSNLFSERTEITLSDRLDPSHSRHYIGYGASFADEWCNASLREWRVLAKRLLADERFQEVSAVFEMKPEPTKKEPPHPEGRGG